MDKDLDMPDGDLGEDLEDDFEEDMPLEAPVLPSEEDLEVGSREGEPLTVEALRGVMPKRQRHNVTPELVEHLNGLIDDSDARDAFRENLVGYTGVLQNSSVSIKSYIQAVRYVSYKLLGYSNQESWIKTFPKRYQRLLDEGKDAGFMRSTVACYNRNKTVNAIMEQTMVPSYVLNQDLYQRAINIQAELMLTAKSEKVRTDAANSLLVHLKQPEVTKVSLDIKLKEDESIQELREVTLELARRQRLMIESGAMNAREVAEGRLITGDFERVA